MREILTTPLLLAKNINYVTINLNLKLAKK